MATVKDFEKETRDLLKRNTTQKQGQVGQSKPTSAAKAFEQETRSLLQKDKKQGKSGFESYKIDNYLRDANNFLVTASKELQGMTYQNAGSQYTSKLKQSEDLKNRGFEISQYLNQHRDELDDKYVHSVKNAIKEIDGASKQAMAKFLDIKQAYSLWESEDDYNAYLAQLQDDEEKSRYDIDAGQKEIEALEEQLKQLRKEKAAAGPKRAVDNSYLGSPYAAVQQKEQSYQAVNTAANGRPYAAGLQAQQAQREVDPTDLRIRELEKQISQKKQYLNQAKHIQEGIAFAGVVDNADFKDNSGYVSTYDGSTWSKLISQYGMCYEDLTYEYINNQNGIRDEIESKSTQYGHETSASESPMKKKGYDLLNAKEISIYNYYYAKEGKEKAQEYLDNIQETLNRRKATGMFETMKGNTALELAFGAAAGLDQFASGMKNVVNFKDDYIAQTAYQMASGMVREDLADDSIPVWYNFKEGKWEDKVLGSSVGQMGYDFITTSANMAPSILASTAIGLLNPTAGAAVGNALMGTSAAGNAYQTALNSGYDKNAARAYGVAIGVAETAMQSLLGGISSLGGVSPAVTKAVEGIDNGMLRFFAKYGASMASEGLEEGLQEVLDPILQNAILGADENVDWANVAYSALLGAASAGVFEIGGNIREARQEAAAKAEYGNKTDELLAEGLSYDAGTEANEIAQQYKARVDSGKSMTGAQIKHQLEANKVQRVETAAKDRLVELGETDDPAEIAKLATKRAIGEALKPAEKSRLARSKFGAQVAKELVPENVAKGKLVDAMTRPGKYKPLDTSVETDVSGRVSESGKNELADSGAEFDLKQIDAKTGNDGKLVWTVDGHEATSENIKFKDEDTAYIFEAVEQIENITPTAAPVLVRSVDTSKNITKQLNGLDEAYTYGFYNYSIEDLKAGEFVAGLTETQMMDAYRLGEAARARVTEKIDTSKVNLRTAEQKAEQVKKRMITDDTEVYFADGSEVVKFDQHNHQYDEKRMAGVNAAKFLSKMGIGGKFYFYESYMKNGVRVYKNASGEEVPAPNGMFKAVDGSIYIDMNAGNTGEGTTLFTIGHELTHFVRAYSEKQFKRLSDLVKEAYDKTELSMHQRVIAKQETLSKIRNEHVSYDEAYEEVVADAMSTMLTDGNLYEKLAELRSTDKSLFETIKKFFDELISKFVKAYKSLTPDQQDAQDIRELKDMFDSIQTAFAEALVEASDNFSAEKNTTEDGGAFLNSLREFEDGTRFVDVQMDAHVFDGMTVSQMNQAAKTILTDKFAGKVIGIDNRVFVNGDSVNEYLHPSKSIDMDTRKAKLTAAGELDNLLDAGKALPNKPDGEDGHVHPDAIDFSYFKTIFKVGNEYFEGIVNIKNIKRGKLLKDVTKIRNITQDIVSSYGDNPKSNFLRDVSMYSIRNENAVVKNESAEAMDLEVDEKTESVAPAVLMSERTWTESDYVQERDKAAKEIANAIGVSETKAREYIDSVNSIAKMIAEDRTRLDYFSSPYRSSFVSNAEYGGSFDFSTLCKKRRLLTGTFTAIQKALPNTALTANEILDIRNRMKKAGLEVSCGLCYVEGSRANMGQFAKEFLKLYKQYYPDAWQPNMADVNTPDGIEWVRINHPECYEQYEYFWNHYGTLKSGDKNLFASQQKPKLYQLHTEYKGEILKVFNGDEKVEEKNRNGGIRLQSFSDFEIVHLIDTMQIIMDMSRVGLAGQAYTKVPDFAWALGDTGLKINLSLIAKGVDADGNLIFDNVEGMPIDEAMKLRVRYSQNVGTILVAFNDEQLRAAMADERVDFIIPFHRSQWKKSQYEAMGLPAKTKDYTYMQNEKFIKPQYHKYRGRMVQDKATNYMPNEYWDFSKSGKENAEAYLEMCARNNKRPKFYKLLQNNGDGSYSLKADGSTDGYWKLLIDFKMYDNNGVGSPQMAVKPEFNMNEANRMLDEYKGGHSQFPVAQGIVDEFVREYKTNHNNDIRYSERTPDSISNRHLLANALESATQNGIELKRLLEYKKAIDDITAEEEKLTNLNAQIREMSFAKGPRDTAKIKQLREDAERVASRVQTYDSRLLRLEAAKPIKDLLERERKVASEKAKAQAKTIAEKEKLRKEVKQIELLREVRETRSMLNDQKRDTALIEKEFIRLAKEYEKQKSRGETLAERNADTINSLKNKLKENVTQQKQDRAIWEKEYARLLREYEASDRSITKLEAKIERQKASAKKKVLSRKKTELRKKIRRTIMDLDNFLNKGDKKRNVKDGLRVFVDQAIKATDVLFMDDVKPYDMLRAGFTAALTESEKAQVEEARQMLDELDEIYSQSDAQNPAKDPEFVAAEARLDAKIAEMSDIFERENMAREETTVSNVISKIMLEYKKLEESPQIEVRNAYSDAVYEHMGQLAKVIGNTRIKDMSVDQLQNLYQMYSWVKATVTMANKFFAENIKQNVSDMAAQSVTEFGRAEAQRKKDKRTEAVYAVLDKIGWSNEKVTYALRRMNNSVITTLMQNIIDGEDVTMRDVQDAIKFRKDIEKKYNYKQWDFDKTYTFEDKHGEQFEMQLEHLLSFYAYSRREAARSHITKGGITIKTNSLLKKESVEAHAISEDGIAKMESALTEEQRAYVREMQSYLSDVMGAKGNEVSLKLYGIKMFNEESYFPIQSTEEYLAKVGEADLKVKMGITNMASAGFTKSVVQEAATPIKVGGFLDVWANHVNEMSRYHGFVLPMEDFRRVFNFTSYGTEEKSTAVRAAMTNAFGKDAVKYFDDLYRDLNSGASADRTNEKFIRKYFGKFKKNAVSYSLSVVVQQPTAIVRAGAMIDKKYFGFFGSTGRIAVGVTRLFTKNHTKLWNEMLEYAPGVTTIKDIGGFDTATGGSILSALKEETYENFSEHWNAFTKHPLKWTAQISDDNILSRIPAYADQIAWVEIWNAVKREIVATNKSVTANSKEHLELAGKRFSEVIRMTQVYDSVFAKSPLMRSQNFGAQMITSFMAEPNTTINMVEDGIREITRGHKRIGTRILWSVAASITFNNLIKSVVYAMRDDDEDQNFKEKYLEAVIGGMLNDFNPLNYIPIARDVWSAALGYDVERADITLFSDLADNLTRVTKLTRKDTSEMDEEQLGAHEKAQMAAYMGIVDSIGALTTFPIKNIRRDVKGFINTFLGNKVGESTKLSLAYTVEQAWNEALPTMLRPETTPKTDVLYETIMAGDATYLNRLKNGYKDEKAYTTAVRKALRENDPRVAEAAQALYENNASEYKRLYQQIRAENKFSAADILSAIDSEASALKKDTEGESKSAPYSASDFVKATVVGDSATAKAMLNEYIAFMASSGVSKDDAVKKFQQSVYNSVSDSFHNGMLTRNTAKKLLVDHAGKSADEAEDRITYWEFKKKYPQYNLSDDAVWDYYDIAEPLGIGLRDYVNFIEGKKTIETKRDENGTVIESSRDQTVALIHSLNLTDDQKDALYILEGYSKNKLGDTPWH